MENDETTNGGEVEQQDTQTVEVEETPAEESETDSQSETVEVTPEDKLAHAQAEAAKYRRLFEKSQKPKVQVAPKAPQTASPSNTEEVVILDKWIEKGVPKAEELLVQLKKVAQVSGISLLKAQTDPIFVAVKEKFEKNYKLEQASLPASRGSGGVKASKTASTPGLTREEHKAIIMSSL